MEYNLAISGRDHLRLRKHLYPGDGLEAVAIVLCGRFQRNDYQRLLAHEIIPVPYEDCLTRSPDKVTWSTNLLIPHLERAAKKGFAVLKIHSHPNGYPSFSNTDNEADRELFESVFGWVNNDRPHGSAVMLPDGTLFGRVIRPDLSFEAIQKISIVGDDLHFWSTMKFPVSDAFAARTMQTFGEGTTSRLKGLKVGVVGCSGTGSVLIEQLVRLGVGHLVLIDPDNIEAKNINRIIHSTMNHAASGAYKVDVLRQAIESIGIGTKVTGIAGNIYDNRDHIAELASCDVLFGCVDTIDGRHLLNQVGTFYLLPYFDLGIKLVSDGKGGISQIMGTVHYVQPGKSSLLTRGVYNSEGLRSASLYRKDRRHYEQQRISGYIVDVVVNSPAVISINSQVASLAVNEFLARIHPYRYDDNAEFAINRVSFTDGYTQHEREGDPDQYLNKFVGRGDMDPLLNMPEL